jgi:hypothetical protein
MLKYITNLFVILLTLVKGPISNFSLEDSIVRLDHNKQSVEKYIDEIKDLKEEVESLEKEKTELEKKLNSSNNNFNNYLYNVFNPQFLHVGDKMLKCEVAEIEESKEHREVIFSGKLDVKLIISKVEGYNGDYEYKLSKEYYNKVPIDIFTYTKSLDYDYPMDYYMKKEDEDKLIKEIGDKYYDGIEVMVTLKNYSMIYDQSNFANWVEFVKLDSIVSK